MTQTNKNLAQIITEACSNSSSLHIYLLFPATLTMREENFYPSSINFVEPFRKFQSIIRTHIPLPLSFICTRQMFSNHKRFLFITFLNVCRYYSMVVRQPRTVVINFFFEGS